MNQKQIDYHLMCLQGHGIVDYAYDDCKVIQEVLKERLNIFLSVPECYEFWHRRSEEWSACFLSIRTTKTESGKWHDEDEIVKWFDWYLKGNDNDFENTCELLEERGLEDDDK